MQACHTCDAGMQRPGNPHFFIVVAEDDSSVLEFVVENTKIEDVTDGVEAVRWTLAE